jgi:hypothetical protein
LHSPFAVAASSPRNASPPKPASSLRAAEGLSDAPAFMRSTRFSIALTRLKSLESLRLFAQTRSRLAASSSLRISRLSFS